MHQVLANLLNLGMLLGCISHSMAQTIDLHADFLNNVSADSGKYTHVWIPSTDRLVKISGLGRAFGPVGPMQKVIKTSGKLYLIPDGTGQVYSISRHKKGIVALREDSTFFVGYNFGAFVFAFKDTLYSYGGYGFWHYNGKLRIYDKARHEWQWIPLSKEIPIQVANFQRVTCWFDSNSSDLYVCGMPRTQFKQDSIYILNVAKKTWRTLGVSNISSDDFAEQVHSKWGIISRSISSKGDVYCLVDFKSNLIRTLNARKATELKAKENWSLPVFYSDSIIYFSGGPVIINDSDFVGTDRSVIKPIVKPTSIDGLRNLSLPLLETVGVLILLSIVLWVIMKGKNKNAGADQRLQHSASANLFDDREKDLIQLILKNSATQSLTTIEDINRILGLSEKSPDLQKKHRSDTIISINKKYGYYTKTDSLLLKRYRSVQDKRSFEYFID